MIVTHTIIAKNTTSGTISFPDLGGFYVVASGTETISDYFENRYIETSIDLKDNIQSGDIVINDGQKDLTVQQGLFHVKDLSFQKILEYLAALTVIGLADTPSEYSDDRYLESTGSGIEWKKLTDLFYDKVGVNTISGALMNYFTNLNLVDLIDIPDNYDDGKYLRSTVSGTEWVTISGIDVEDGVHIIEHGDSESESTTTSTLYQQKLKLTTSVVPAGDYLVMWYYEWQYKHGGFYFKSQIQIDDTIDLMEHHEQPSSVDSWHPMGGFKRETLTEGSHYIDLDYCSSQSGKEAKIRNVRLEFWGV